MRKETIRILIIEDEPIAQKVLQGMLEKKACAVDIASNSKEALAIAEYSYHLIFIDCGLPKIDGIDMDGYELTRQIRQREKDKVIPPRPIVMLTAFSKDEDTVMKCKSAGIDAYYTKPLNPLDLEVILQKYIKYLLNSTKSNF